MKETVTFDELVDYAAQKFLIGYYYYDLLDADPTQYRALYSATILMMREIFGVSESDIAHVVSVRACDMIFEKMTGDKDKNDD